MQNINPERLQRQLESYYEEIDKLSKKKPDDAINIFKLKLINETLEKAKEWLKPEYLPFTDFKIFSEDDLPTNSDVLLVLGQFVSAVKNQRY